MGKEPRPSDSTNYFDRICQICLSWKTGIKPQEMVSKQNILLTFRYQHTLHQDIKDKEIKRRSGRANRHQIFKRINVFFFDTFKQNCNKKTFSRRPTAHLSIYVWAT